MLMPKEHTKKIYEAIFEDGVMVAKKDVHLKKHQHPLLSKNNIPNLHVIQTMRSLVSRGYIKERFAWRHYYWYLTNEGIVYLRNYLHLPDEVVPATLKVKKQEAGAGMQQRARLVGKGGAEGGGGDDRGIYRPRQQQWGAGGGAGGADKDTGLARDQPMEYRGGFGRGQREQ